MIDIDFLPQRYRDRAVRVRARAWRFGMVGCLVGFAVVVAGAQFLLQRSVRNELATITEHYPAALAASAQADLLRRESRDHESYAALYTYLQHPWPTTRMVAGVVESIPETVAIGSLSLEASAPPAGPPAPPEPETHPADADLRRLRAERDPVILSWHVTGTATDAQDLHRYVSRIAPSTYFSHAKLESVESTTSPTGEVQSAFELRLVVRPGFGQPGGPSETAAASATVASATSSSGRPGT